MVVFTTVKTQVREDGGSRIYLSSRRYQNPLYSTKIPNHSARARGNPQATHDNFSQANVTLARQSEAHPLQVS